MRSTIKIFAAVLGLLVTAVAGPAFADPCEAPLPSQAGAEFSGVVRYVVDGDGLCVGPASGGGATWIEVRLMDFDAPELRQPGGEEARQTLRRLVFGRRVDCVVTPGRRGTTTSYDRTHAVCRLGGRRVGDLMRAAGVTEGGN
ncbi:MAG: hypothetical protein R3C30_09475 [Hyphomonadaceae bacterium]